MTRAAARRGHGLLRRHPHSGDPGCCHHPSHYLPDLEDPGGQRRPDEAQPHTEHPHGLTDEDYDALTKDKPIIFAFTAIPPWCMS